MNLFVAGLPRSRTAWLSVFLSQSDTYFYHDGFNGCRTLDEYKEKVSGHGDCSTGLTIIDVEKEFPDSKVVIIKKNEKELVDCIQWCNRTYCADSEEYIRNMQSSLLSMNGLVIEQSQIDNNLRDIWEYLLTDEWQKKYVEMKKFNIQTDPFYIDVNAARGFYASIQ